MRKLNFNEIEQVAGGNVLTDLHTRFKAGISRQDVEYGIFSASAGLALGGLLLKGGAGPICAIIIVAGMLGYDYYNPSE